MWEQCWYITIQSSAKGTINRQDRHHAEVNCLRNVKKNHKDLIPLSTLFISLEPCCIHRRTPACTDLIRRAGIRTVVFGPRDTTDAVDGRSVGILRGAGIEVREYPDFVPTLRSGENRRLFTTLHRPFVLLKFARSADGFLRPADRDQPYWITGPVSRRLVHRWRTLTSAILVGGATVTDDDPLLDTRLFPGPAPLAVVLDPRGRCTGNERLFQREDASVLLFSNSPAPALAAQCALEQLPIKEKTPHPAMIARVLDVLHERRIMHLTVEGGATILNAFLTAEVWDEARVFTGNVHFGGGLPAPVVPGEPTEERRIGWDTLRVFTTKALSGIKPV